MTEVQWCLVVMVSSLPTMVRRKSYFLERAHSLNHFYSWKQPVLLEEKHKNLKLSNDWLLQAW